ncbi:hypothetical protein ACFX13_040420 [Malus domestica]
MKQEPSQDANGPPKVDSKVEILREKVTKQIIKEGHGQNHPSIQHASYTTGHGLKARDTSLKTHGINNDHLK